MKNAVPAGRQGFTIIEIVVYIAVLVVIVGAVFSFLLWTAQSQVVVGSQRRLSIIGSQALEHIAKEVREATSVYEPTSVFAATPGQLSLETQKDLAQGERETFVDFFKCGQQLCMKKEGSSPLALTPPEVAVDNLVFTKVVSGAMPSVKITLGLALQESELEISQTISLRRYVAP